MICKHLELLHFSKNDIGILIEAPLNPIRSNKESNDLTGEKQIPNNIAKTHLLLRC